MTRPQPPISPAMAGAVDLSALKQRPQSGAAPAGVGTEITEANFQQEVLARSNQIPVVVLLWSPRSAACAELGETLATLAESAAGRWALASVNVDAEPRLAQSFGVEAVPTVLAIGAGQPLTGFQGAQPAAELQQWLDSLLDAVAGKLDGVPAESGAEEAPVDPAVARARAHLDAGDFDAALQAYQDVLADDPGHEEARGAVRQIGFVQRAGTRPADAVAVADAAPDDIEAALAAADVELLHQDAAAAFDRLIALVRRTAGDDRATVRTRLIELFELFDPADPVVITGRRNLANALY
ncbi:tetratricopeptide repeat protein [Mycolicibacillus trivialis]|uniref:Co-chaperone YbbN n=1 Tax=Mycolicibacillus trivialis TaxID=1798 RepID=A0A1X2EFR0_9MYCO|nr:tetratricopeptide repeat protein [Mycolicibacillus trivialis]ORW99299.1 co-chaperone YbbN [Mycolicibacillus trivialis]